LLAEFRSAGFTVVEQECYAPSEPGAPGGLRVRCAVEREWRGLFNETDRSAE
jgi:hypothetical protein